MLARTPILRLGILLCATLGVTGCSSTPPSAPSSKLNQIIGFQLPSDGGALVSVPVAGAQATVLDFFAPSCVPCRTKVPALVDRAQEIGARGARLVLVAVLADVESSADARAALSEWGVDESVPFLVDRAELSQRSAAVTELPATLVLDDDGRLRWVAPPDAKAADVLAALP